MTTLRRMFPKPLPGEKAVRSLIQVSAGIAVACGLFSSAALAAPPASFAASAAMEKAGVTWDDKSLDAYIADPQKAIPGNVMPFPGVADAKQRAEIIDYLKTVK